ncbi:MAG TPA: hypothetical protein VEI02_02540 [Planctomycetota bacterium]|nr:hypothetical protein [Planctomycetota bacterium]
MRKYLIGAAITAAVFVGASFAWAPERAVRTTGPLRLADLTLDRAFLFTAPIGDASSPTVLPANPNAGVVLTTVLGPAQTFVSIDGLPPIPLLPQPGQNDKVLLDPPIVVRPGQAFAIWTNTYAGYQATLGGYFVYPGEV